MTAPPNAALNELRARGLVAVPCTALGAPPSARSLIPIDEHIAARVRWEATLSEVRAENAALRAEVERLSAELAAAPAKTKGRARRG